MTESDIEFLARRAAQELQLAEETKDTAAAAIHRRMAALYADRMASLTDDPDLDPIVQTRLTT